MAETKSTKKEQPMLDPIAYRSNYSEDNIIGNDKATTEVTSKYEGEGADNVYNPYNKDIKIADLDPNYQYGQPAKEINAVDDKYITTRNDNIASALYNEGKVNYNDVVSFLQGQQNWFNSSEEERANTTSNVWNRLGQISAENQKTEKTDNQKGADTSKMESDLDKSTSATIYGKDTAQEGDPTKGIKTNEDVNSPFKIMEEARIAKVESLAGMDSMAIAATMFTGEVPYGEQAMSDLQKWMPEKYAEIQDYYKKLVGQANVDAITSGGEMTTTADRTDTTTQTTSYAVNNATLSVSATQLLKSIDTILDSSDTAKSANDLMGSIENDMAKLKNRLMNLKKEANTVFKGDAPDYLVKAYINNRTQEIQNQLSILEDRYNAAYDRYKTELSHAEWETEMDLKKDAQELERWKAKNTSSSTSSSSDSKYSVAERNNNPTNMTVDFMKIVGAELGVDYEVGTDSFINSNGKRQYYAKLIGDPVETTIRVLDKALANGVNPFTTTSWSYIGKLGLTKEKWQNMSMDEKKEMINKWLPYEGGSMENMAYYVNQADTGESPEEDLYYPEAWEDTLMRIANGTLKLNSATAATYAKMMNTDVEGMGKYVENYQKKQLINGKAAGKDILNLMAELQIFFEDKGLKKDGSFDTSFWNATTLGNIGGKHDQLIEQLKLNKVTEARNKGATFGQMTEYEWKVLEKAASALSILKKTDKQYTDEFKKIMRATWIATFGREPTAEEWQDYVNQQRAYQSFQISAGSTQSEESKLDSIGKGNNGGGGINFTDVVTNGK